MRLRRREITSEPDRANDIGVVMAAHQRGLLLEIRRIAMACRDGHERDAVNRIRDLLDPKPADISADTRPVIRHATGQDRSHFNGVPNEVRECRCDSTS